MPGWKPFRRSRGRQRIKIQRIKKTDDMYAAFSKRRVGLYKKASELSTLCGVDVGIIMFSPKDKPYSFFQPSMESVLERYQNPDQPVSDYTWFVEAHSRACIEEANKKLDEVLEKKEKLKEREKYLDEIAKTRPKCWWEEAPDETWDEDRVKEYVAWFENLRARIINRIEELKNGASASGSTDLIQNQQQPLLQQQNVQESSTNMPVGGQQDAFLEGYDLTGSSYYDSTGGMLGGMDLFSSQLYNVPSLQQSQPGMYFQFPSPFSAQPTEMPGEYCHVPRLPTQVQNSSISDGGITHGPSYFGFPGATSQVRDMTPPGSQNLGHNFGPYNYLPDHFQGQDMPIEGGGGAEFFDGQFGCFPRQDQNPDYGFEGGGHGDGDDSQMDM